MKKKYKVRTSSLTQLLQIGKSQEPEPEFYCNGFFDEQKNYHPNPEYPECDIIFPWEWVLFPEVVEFAKRQGVEVPIDPPIDLSRTF